MTFSIGTLLNTGIFIIHRFHSGGSTEYERAVICLMSVEICIRCSEHLRKHFRFCFGDQRLDQIILHRYIDSNSSQNLPTGISRCHDHLFPFKYMFCSHNLANLSFDLP